MTHTAEWKNWTLALDPNGSNITISWRKGEIQITSTDTTAKNRIGLRIDTYEADAISNTLQKAVHESNTTNNPGEAA